MIRRAALLCAGVLAWAIPAAHAQCPDGSPPPCARPAATPRRPPAPPSTSVAVLYFENASPDSADAYLAEGITEEVISRLGQVGRLQVKSRYFVRRYRVREADDPATIGRELGVASIVTGSVRRSGERVRVTAEMVRTTTGNVVWSERYDREDADVLSLQADLANAVATAITGRLLPAERQAIAVLPTRNRQAWDHFLRGNFYLAQRTPLSHDRAVSEYEAASRLDPGFTRAVARTAYVYAIASWRSELVHGLAPDSSWRLARSAAERAVRAEPALSDAWMALGLMQIQLADSVAAGRASLERAIALDSANAEATHVLGWALYYQGRRDEARAAFHRALALEPGRPITIAVLGFIEAVEHRWADAERLVDSAIAMDRAFYQGYFNRSAIRYERGDTAGLRADYAVLGALTGDAALDSIAHALIALYAGDSTQMRALLVREAQRLAGSDAADRQVLRLAGGLATVGETTQALDWLERTRWRNGNFHANLLLTPFDRMRGNPRYERLLDEWRIPAGVPGERR